MGWLLIGGLSPFFYFIRQDWLHRWLLIGGLGISVACVQRVEAEPEMSQRVEVVNVH